MVEGHVAQAVEVQVLSSALSKKQKIPFMGIFCDVGEGRKVIDFYPIFLIMKLDFSVVGKQIPITLSLVMAARISL
jgi:hypothetical protein